MYDSDKDIITSIINILFKAENYHLDTQLYNIVKKQNNLANTNESGFWYLGKIYVPKVLRYHNLFSGFPTIRSELIDEFQYYKEHADKVSKDKQLLKQVFSKVFTPDVVYYEDFRDFLPDCLVQLVPYLSDIPRSREVAWVIKDNKPLMKVWNEHLPIIEYYSAIRLMY